MYLISLISVSVIPLPVWSSNITQIFLLQFQKTWWGPVLMSLYVPAVLVHLLIIKKRSLAATALRAPPYFETILCKFCSTSLLSYFWLERLPSCVTLFPEQTDTSGQVKLSILHLSSALVFLTIWPDQLCQFVPLCLPPQKDCYKVSPSYFTTIQTFLRFFFQDILTKCKVSPSYLTTNQNFLRFFPKFQDILTKYCPPFSNQTKPQIPT